MQRERRVGVWVEYAAEHGECSRCGNRVDLVGGKHHRWCSECGATMKWYKALDGKVYQWS